MVGCSDEIGRIGVGIVISSSAIVREVVVWNDAIVLEIFGHSRSYGGISSNSFEACTVGVLQINGSLSPFVSADIYNLFNNVCNHYHRI